MTQLDIEIEALRKRVAELEAALATSNANCDRMSSLAIDNAKDTLTLRAEVDRLRAALQPFAEYGTPGSFHNLPPDTNVSIVVEPHVVWLEDALRVSEFLAARAAMERKA